MSVQNKPATPSVPKPQVTPVQPKPGSKPRA